MFTLTSTNILCPSAALASLASTPMETGMGEVTQAARSLPPKRTGRFAFCEVVPR